MKSFIRTFLLATVVGIVFWTFYFGVIRDSPAYWGIIAGVVFGLAIATVTTIRQQRVSESPPVLTKETILREGPATHDGMAGQLYLTDRRILFEGYPTDENSPEVSTIFDGRADDAPAHEVSIPILRIAEAKRHAIGIDSRLDIVLTDGDTKCFGTEGVADWLDDISTARQKVLDEPRSEEMKLFP